MAFGIVHRNAVGGDVDTCPVRSAHTQGGIADACSGITGGQCRRCHTEQIRDILPEVLLFEFLFRHVGKCYGSLRSGTCGYYLHLLQVYYFQAVCLARLREDACSGYQAAGKNHLFHVANLFFSTPALPGSGQRVCSQPVMLRHPYSVNRWQIYAFWAC